MTALKGIYENGEIKLETKPTAKGPLKVVVTFLEDEVMESGAEKTAPKESGDYIRQFSRAKKRNVFNELSWKKTREISKDYKGSLSDAVVEEREEYR